MVLDSISSLTCSENTGHTLAHLLTWGLTGRESGRVWVVGGGWGLGYLEKALIVGFKFQTALSSLPATKRTLKRSLTDRDVLYSQAVRYRYICF